MRAGKWRCQRKVPAQNITARRSVEIMNKAQCFPVLNFDVDYGQNTMSELQVFYGDDSGDKCDCRWLEV